MARPIRPTPIIKGNDAEKLSKEIDRIKSPSIQTIENLDKCAKLYKHFYSRKKETK